MGSTGSTAPRKFQLKNEPARKSECKNRYVRKFEKRIQEVEKQFIEQEYWIELATYWQRVNRKSNHTKWIAINFFDSPLPFFTLQLFNNNHLWYVFSCSFLGCDKPLNLFILHIQFCHIKLLQFWVAKLEFESKDSVWKEHKLQTKYLKKTVV